MCCFYNYSKPIFFPLFWWISAPLSSRELVSQLWLIQWTAIQTHQLLLYTLWMHLSVQVEGEMKEEKKKKVKKLSLVAFGCWGFFGATQRCYKLCLRRWDLRSYYRWEYTLIYNTPDVVILYFLHILCLCFRWCRANISSSQQVERTICTYNTCVLWPSPVIPSAGGYYPSKHISSRSLVLVQCPVPVLY